MKRILLLFFVASLLAIKGNGQSPQIVIGTTSLTETLLFGDTAVVSLVIHNTGNRDLNYELSVTGSVVEFEKEIYADWTLPENQDQIYPGTFITRKDQQGIFNIALEAGYSYDPSPENTEWAYGRTADLDPGDYQIWVDAVDGYPVQMVNRYNLARITESYCVIQGMGMLNSSEAFVEDTGMGRVESTVSGSQTYDFQMDRRSGWINRCVSRQRLMIQTTILESPSLPAGLKIPSYTETVFEVTGSGEINN